MSVIRLRVDSVYFNQNTLNYNETEIQNFVDDTSTKICFSYIVSNFEVTDINNYIFEKISSDVLEHVLHTVEYISERDVHDYYSTTRFSVSCSITINNSKTNFEIDYGGIL